jgi:hypothetical protein
VGIHMGAHTTIPALRLQKSVSLRRRHQPTTLTTHSTLPTMMRTRIHNNPYAKREKKVRGISTDAASCCGAAQHD